VPARDWPAAARPDPPSSATAAPHVAQNVVAGPTGDPHRAHVGPEPGAVRRRPQCGQNGRAVVAELPQKGQRTDSAGVGATGARGTTRVP